MSVILGTAIGAGALASPAMAAPHNNHNNNNSIEFQAVLRGDGWGAFNAELSRNGRLCYSLYVRGIDAEEAYIRIGGRTIELDEPRRNVTRDCERLSDREARALAFNRIRASVVVEGDDGDEVRGWLRRDSGWNGDW